MRRGLVVGLGWLVCGAAGAWAQSEKPLDTQFVDCVQDAQKVCVAGRTVRTPTFPSPQSVQAFGVVRTGVRRGGALSVSKLYVVEPGSGPRLVFEQGEERDPSGTVLDGNGIASIRWSPTGKRVLFGLVQWTWASDAGAVDKYVLLTVGATAQPIPVGETIWKRFGRECAADIKVGRWLDDDHVEVVTKPFVPTDEEGKPNTPSCVQRTVRSSYQVETGEVKPLAEL